MSIKIVVDQDKKIDAIQEEFNSLFPYLKLEFYLSPSKPNRPLRYIKNKSKAISKFKIEPGKRNFNITSDITAAEIHKSFMDIYGLGVQLFRKSGKAWLEATLTDSWTLAEQNGQGEELSRNYR
jgi:hypothetical protein